MNDQTSKATIPISALNPFIKKWGIKARVIFKSQLRSWKNDRGGGKIMTLELADSSGKIVATAFNENAERFYRMLELNQVYIFRDGLIKPTNKKDERQSITNDFEISLLQTSKVEPSNNDEDEIIPDIQYDFVSLKTLKNISANNFVDIAGICKKSSELKSFVSHKTDKEIKNRIITLVDDSNVSYDVTVWDSMAEEFAGDKINKVVIIKGVKIVEFNGKKLDQL